MLNFLVLVLLFFLTACSKSPDHKAQDNLIVYTSRLPAGWYTQDRQKLNLELENYLAQAQSNFPVLLETSPVRALIAPHAGYWYSGLCAASAYQTLSPSYNRVIVLAPSHTLFFNGIALPNFTVYRTVLGDINVDSDALKKLKHHLFKVFPEPYLKEHALEMQLPFLQKKIPGVSLVPLIVGHLKHEDLLPIAQTLKKIIDDKTLVVISSDFTHHGKNFEYSLFDKNIIDHVRMLDSFAAQAIFNRSLSGFYRVLQETGATICGQEPIKLLLALLELKAFGDVKAQLCCYYTSAHVTQARNKNSFDIQKLFEPVPDSQGENSVSYMSMIFSEKTDRLSGYEQKALLALARQTLENYFKKEQDRLGEQFLWPMISPGINLSSGAFVTLKTKTGELRGCIGRIITPEPLYKTIGAMSLAAAFQDTRFTPLKEQELKNIIIEITILTKPKKVNNYKDILIGKHGVILNKLNSQGTITHTAVFLPQVALEQSWDLETMLEQLSVKAGLGRDSWKENCTFEVFEGFEITELDSNK